MIYTGYVLGWNKDIKDYYLEIYWIAAFNLKMSFFPGECLDGCFLEPLYFFFFFESLYYFCVPKCGYIKIHGPNAQLPRSPYLFTKNKYFWSKTWPAFKKMIFIS